MPRAFLVLFLVVGCGKSHGVVLESECPKDLLAARGSSCSPDGKTCGTGQKDFTHLLMCSRGKWTELEAPPPPPAH